MVARVLIQGGVDNAMRVSKPGIDVETANIDQTVFDSRWSGLIPYMKGTINALGGGGGTINFGETLDAAPLFVGYFQNTITFGGSAVTAFGNTPVMLTGPGAYWYYVLVTPSNIQYSTAGIGGQTSRLTFTLFKRPAG
jgi:hypothetical protein